MPRIPVIVSDERWRQIRDEADRRGVSMAQLMRELTYAEIDRTRRCDPSSVLERIEAIERHLGIEPRGAERSDGSHR